MKFKTKARLVVVGSSNTDLVLTCTELPRPGETLQGGALQTFGGGKGANQAVAAARAGAQVTFIGACGEDDYGRDARRTLKQEGIHLKYFTVKKGATSGVAMILLGGRDRQNMIVVADSANQALTMEDVTAAEPAIRRAGAVLASLEVPVVAVLAAAELAKRHGVPFILNPAPASKLPKKLFRLTHTLVPNEHEAACLTGEKDFARAANMLHKRGCQNVVITLGGKGVYASGPFGIVKIPAPKVRAVDTVGAGDCFCGWLSAGMAAGMDLESSARRAVQAASLAVTRPGAQPGMPSLEEILSARQSFDKTRK